MRNVDFYESPAKQTWRGWVWNRIAERVPKLNLRDSLVLYLVGPVDRDREVAVSKGFRNENLIAIDLDEDCVGNVRAAGYFGIAGRMEDIVAMWPIDMPITAIVADFTCGLSQTVDQFMYSLLMSRGVMMGKTIVAVNMQRGRDPHSNVMRHATCEALEEFPFAAPPRRQIKTRCKRGHKPDLLTIEEILTDPLHRGKQLFGRLYWSLCGHLREEEGFSTSECISAGDEVIKATRPVFNSYRQRERMPYMDSVVMTMFPGRSESFPSMLHIYETETGRNMETIKRKIAAYRAVRTKRLG